MKYVKKFIDVNGKQMAYVDEGSGDTVLFLHGIPLHHTYGETLPLM